MGKVFEAEEAGTGRRVALKLVSADYAASGDAVERFRQEGRLASLIAHPRCVFVLAADEEAGRPYIVMELMPGANLDDYVRANGAQPPQRAVAMILDVIEGLQEAHRVGVVHRDVKPSNCFFGSDGRLKIGDFGLAKSLAQGSNLTRTGSFLGTPLYASPEQVRGETVDAQTDIYSTAATLYYLLTGRAPFQSDNPAVTLARIAADPTPPMRTIRPELPVQLDAVVLRGLERDRKRRWQNMDEFAAALRPFVGSHSPLANFGLRFGAFALDYLILFAVGFLMLPLQVAMGWDPTEPLAAYEWSAHLIGTVVWLLYFSVSEGIWNRSLGKWLLGLRVRDASTGGDARFGRIFLRTLVSYLLPNAGAIITVILFPLFKFPPHLSSQDALPYIGPLILLSFIQIGGLVGGIVLLLCTMRDRNGLRGLHEFVSGTRVEALPVARKTWAPPTTPPGHTLSRLPGVPDRVGPFTILGAYRGDERVKIAVGQDAALGRNVILYLRPAADGPLPLGRREVDRTTRLRWLASGQLDALVWDAFLAPTGCSLPALIAAHGCMPWARFQHLLIQLTDELKRALKEDTLPSPLTPEMVWVRNNGQLVLLDVSLSEADPTNELREAAQKEKATERDALALLGQVAVLGLEGRLLSAHALPKAVAVPLPLPARAALGNLLAFRANNFGLEDFQEVLAGSRHVPAEVNRGRRIGQLALLVTFQFFALGFCLSPLWAAMRFGINQGIYISDSNLAESNIARLDDASLSDFLCDGINPHPLPRLRAVAQLGTDAQVRRRLQSIVDQRREKEEARLKNANLIFKANAVQFENVLEANRKTRWQSSPRPALTPTSLRWTPNWAADHLESSHDQQEGAAILFWADLITSTAGPLLWILWAFVMRGGLSYRLTGISLVRRDGRPAERFRCLWRAFLVWAPLSALLVLSYWTDDWYWQLWDDGAAPPWLPWLSSSLWWGVWLLCAAYLALAVRFPTRSVHDRLAGTYLVPSR
jgi:hypothetical protein